MTAAFTDHPHDDLAAYALDALEPHERAEVARHVLGCPACAEEVDEMRATAARLIRPVPPPPQVWGRIVEGLALGPIVDPFLRPNGGPATGLPAPTPGHVGNGGNNGLDQGGHSGGSDIADLAGARGGDLAGEPVTPGDGRRLQRPRRSGAVEGPWAAGGVPGRPGTSSPRASRTPARSSPRRWRTPVLAAAAAVAVVAGAVGFLSGRASDGTSTRSVDDLAAAAFADDGNARAVLTDQAGNEVARVVADGSSGYVLVDALATPADGQTYQLWRLDGEAPVSLGVLGSVDGSVEGSADGDSSAVAFPLPSSPASPAAELAITSEPEGGSTAPMGPLVAAGVLPLSG